MKKGRAYLYVCCWNIGSGIYLTVMGFKDADPLLVFLGTTAFWVGSIGLVNHLSE